MPNLSVSTLSQENKFLTNGIGFNSGLRKVEDEWREKKAEVMMMELNPIFIAVAYSQFSVE